MQCRVTGRSYKFAYMKMHIEVGLCYTFLMIKSREMHQLRQKEVNQKAPFKNKVFLCNYRIHDEAVCNA